MRFSYCLLIFCIAFLCGSTALFAQWEWAGGIPASNFESVSSAGNWIIAGGRYAGDWPVSSTDRGESWFTRSGVGPVAFNPVLVTSPTDTFVLAVGSSYSVYRLRDTAKTWVRSDSGLGGAQIHWLAYLQTTVPSPGGVVVAASPASGVFVSTDFGGHWSPSNSGLTTLSTVTATTIDSIFLVGTTDKGIFRSLDKGRTWSPASIGLADTNISVLAASSGWTFAASGSNVYQSTDMGASWSLLPRTAPALVQNLVLVPTPGRGTGVALFAVTSSGHYRLSVSDSDWVRVKTSPYWIGANDIPFTLTAVDSVLYAVDYDQLNCSSDLGNSWFQVGCNIAGEIASGNPSSKHPQPRLYRGQFASTNFGSQWLSLHKSYDDGSHISTLSVSADTSAFGYDRLTVGTDSGAVEFSDDGGLTWKVVHERDAATRGLGCYDIAELDGIIFASLQAGTYYQYPGDTISGVYRTTTEGTSWQKVNASGLTTSLILSLDLFRGKDGGRVLFAGTWFNLFRSTNDGESWSGLDSTAPVRSGRKRLREVNGTLFLCTEGTVQTTYTEDGEQIQTYDSAGVFQSTDDGLTWVEVTGNLKSTFARGFAALAVPQYPDRILLAASIDRSSTSVGPYGDVLTSTEGGKRWTSFGSGLPRFTYSAPVGADDRYIYCMSRRRPWSEAELTAVEPALISQPTTFLLSQNYPNPFNPVTSIRYTVGVASPEDRSGQGHVASVKLVVYDLLGREVATLVNEKKAPGRYEVRFDASHLASGVYLYRMTSGTSMETKKMLLLK